MSAPAHAIASQEERRERLAAMAEECQEVYSERAAEALNGGPVPRFALLTSEGSPESSYRDNPNLTVYDTAEALGEGAADEFNEGWCVLQMVDLDTGHELGWTVRVEVAA